MNTILLAAILVAITGGGATASYVSGYAALFMNSDLYVGMK